MVTSIFIAFDNFRVSGPRSFGVRSPLDNIIVISLGAIMSRAVAGVSPFLPVVICCFVIVLLHRLVGPWSKGTKYCFRAWQLKYDEMKKALVCREDIIQGVHKSALTEDMEKIDKIYMERNGDISAIRKTMN